MARRAGWIIRINLLEVRWNAFAASRAISHAAFALLSDGRHRISYDEVLEAMRQTGKDLSPRYKETGTGGLAVVDR